MGGEKVNLETDNRILQLRCRLAEEQLRDIAAQSASPPSFNPFATSLVNDATALPAAFAPGSQEAPTSPIPQTARNPEEIYEVEVTERPFGFTWSEVNDVNTGNTMVFKVGKVHDKTPADRANMFPGSEIVSISQGSTRV